jgi:hypothetical protein
MKKIIILSTLIFSVMFSSPSFADWKKVGENMNGTFYVDYERIRKRGDYVYYWELLDLPRPDTSGHLSYKLYAQGDCNMFRYKFIISMTYPAPMGEGNGQTQYEPGKWEYPPPDSANEVNLKSVCAYAK